MNIQDIYDRYKVMPSLQLHMYRVAAVATHICRHWTWAQIDQKDIITTLLFHDIWNILKFDLSLYPDFLEPEGEEYWTQVQRETKKYGISEHEATLAIAKEVWIPNSAYTLLYEQEHNYLEQNAKTWSLEVKICEYCDMRVTPHGVVSIEERMNDLKHRDMKNHGWTLEEVTQKHASCLRWWQSIEQELFAQCSLIPEGITDKVIIDIMEELKSWEI